MQPESSQQRVRLFHFNDFHRRLAPFKGGEGGADRLVGKIKQLEGENPGAITLNVGDSTGDNTTQGLDHFQPIPELFNEAGVDIMGLGNHEFEDPKNGYQSLEQGLIKPFKGEVLVANIRHEDGRPIAGTKPYTIRQLQNHAIAFIGVVTRDLASSVFPAAGAALTSLPIEETLREMVAEVREKGAQGVVVLAHDNLNNSKEIARNVPGVDLVFAAHDHRATEQPEEVVRADGSRAWVAEADAYGRAVGQADLLFEDGKVVDVEGLLHSVDQSSPSDPEAANIVKSYQPRERVKMSPKPPTKTVSLNSLADLALHFPNLAQEGTNP